MALSYTFTDSPPEAPGTGTAITAAIMTAVQAEINAKPDKAGLGTMMSTIVTDGGAPLTNLQAGLVSAYPATSAGGTKLASSLQALSEPSRIAHVKAMRGAVLADGTPAQGAVLVETATPGEFERKNTTPFAVPTWQAYRDGTSNFRPVSPAFLKSLRTPQTLTYAATMTIDFGTGASAGNAQSHNLVIPITGNLSIGAAGSPGTAPFAGLTNLVGECFMIKIVVATAGTWTWGFANGGGVVVTPSSTAVSQGIGTSVGDWARALVQIDSATEVSVLAYSRK